MCVIPIVIKYKEVWLLIILPEHSYNLTIDMLFEDEVVEMEEKDKKPEDDSSWKISYEEVKFAGCMINKRS
jgi:hypothetical protein